MVSYVRYKLLNTSSVETIGSGFTISKRSSVLWILFHWLTFKSFQTDLSSLFKNSPFHFHRIPIYATVRAVLFAAKWNGSTIVNNSITLVYCISYQNPSQNPRHGGKKNIPKYAFSVWSTALNKGWLLNYLQLSRAEFTVSSLLFLVTTIAESTRILDCTHILILTFCWKYAKAPEKYETLHTSQLASQTSLISFN